LNLAEAILCTQVATGMDTGTAAVDMGEDVNGDGKIGIGETVYILQNISELRQ
jgi:hypothetical protein